MLTCSICDKAREELIQFTCLDSFCLNCVFLCLLYNFDQIKNVQEVDKEISLKCIICNNGKSQKTKNELKEFLQKTDRGDLCEKNCQEHNLEPKIFCITCDKSICYSCLNSHQMIHVFSNDLNIKRKICSICKDYQSLFHCIDCSTDCCHVCERLYHRDHELTKIKDFYEKYKEDVKSVQLPSDRYEEFVSQLNFEETDILDKLNANRQNIKKMICAVFNNLERSKEEIDSNFEEKEEEIKTASYIVNNIFKKFYDGITDIAADDYKSFRFFTKLQDKFTSFNCNEKNIFINEKYSEKICDVFNTLNDSMKKIETINDKMTQNNWEQINLDQDVRVVKDLREKNESFQILLDLKRKQISELELKIANQKISIDELIQKVSLTESEHNISKELNKKFTEKVEEKEKLSHYESLFQNFDNDFLNELLKIINPNYFVKDKLSLNVDNKLISSTIKIKKYLSEINKISTIINQYDTYDQEDFKNFMLTFKEKMKSINLSQENEWTVLKLNNWIESYFRSHERNKLNQHFINYLYKDIEDIDIDYLGNIYVLEKDLEHSKYDENMNYIHFKANKLNVVTENPVPSLVVSKGCNTRILVVWQDGNLANPKANQLKYIMADKNLEIIKHTQTLNNINEFHSEAIDNQGNGYIVYTSKRHDKKTKVYLAFIDEHGNLTTSLVAFSGKETFHGVHICINRKSGEGLVSVQNSTKTELYFRRFNSNKVFLDETPKKMNVDYYNLYDGHAIGMNERNEYCVIWRNKVNHLKIQFLDSNFKNKKIYVIISDDDISERFRKRHQEIAILNDNFIISDVNSETGMCDHFLIDSEANLLNSNMIKCSNNSIRCISKEITYLFEKRKLMVMKNYL